VAVCDAANLDASEMRHDMKTRGSFILVFVSVITEKMYDF